MLVLSTTNAMGCEEQDQIPENVYAPDRLAESSAVGLRCNSKKNSSTEIWDKDVSKYGKTWALHLNTKKLTETHIKLTEKAI